MIQLRRIKKIINSKVAENYFFMTFLQGASLLIGLLLYPYLIRVLGKEAYGTYIFILSNIQFFSVFISFGFDTPALKSISLFPTDREVKNRTVSEVFTAKVILFVISAIVLMVVIFFIPFVKDNAVLYIVVFSTNLVEILFPSWYFQGTQKMKFVTYVNLLLRIATIPFVLIFVKSPDDLMIYVFIVSSFPVLGGFFTFFYMRIKERIIINFVPIKSLKSIFKEAVPFFWTSAFQVIKSISVTTVIGAFYNMGSVAIWDLANKIISIPRMMTNSVNSALFPNVVQSFNVDKVRKIMKTERYVSILLVFTTALLSYWAILLLGGKTMLSAFPLAVVLSITLYTWLLVGCYINFIFIPLDRTDLVFKCKLIEVTTLIILLLISVLFLNNIIFLVFSVVIAELIEMLYCYFVVKKLRLLFL